MHQVFLFCSEIRNKYYYVYLTMRNYVSTVYIYANAKYILINLTITILRYILVTGVELDDFFSL